MKPQIEGEWGDAVLETLEILTTETLGRTGLPAVQIGVVAEPSYTEIFLFGALYLESTKWSAVRYLHW